MRTAVIVQARMGSSRLPGKVLCTLRGRTVLEHVLRRCSDIPGADQVVCATPDEAGSDQIETVARRCGADVFRGSEKDVLARYLGAAVAAKADVVMRVTSDCPLIDPQLCGAVLALRKREGADYAANNLVRTFPHGLDCEAFTVAALAEAERATQVGYDREHVTPWLRAAAHLKKVYLSAESARHAAERWTLDYAEDLAFLEAVFAELPEGSAGGINDVLEVLERHPEFRELNAQRRVPIT